MQSDMDAMKQAGGSTPSPKPFTPPELIRDFSRPAAPPPPPSPMMPKITPADFTTPKPASMVSPSGPVAQKPVIEEEKSGRDWKKMIIWGVAFILIISAGIGGYMFIYPVLFPPTLPPPAPAITTPPVTEIPAAPAESPVTEIPTALKPHASLLASSDSVSQVISDLASFESLKAPLVQEGQKEFPAGSLSEIFLGNSGGQADASVVLPLLLPEFSADSIKSIFEEDFTTAVFYDANGAWPSYILKLNINSSIVEGQAAAATLESSANLGNLFLSDPGTANTGGFKTGQVSGIATRYLPYSKTGASLNIAWTTDKLVISTSYNGLKKVLTNLAQ